jgi:uncharacterized membrane protein (UPF0127 family)
MRQLVGVSMLLLLFGCTKPVTPAPNTETTRAEAPVQSAVSTGPRVILPDHFAVNVEIADEPETRAQGLMYRDHLAADAGMLFFFEEPGEYPFWMKNTRIPLDMIWIDSERRIVHIKENVPPCRIADCPSYPPNAIASYVLELGGGEAKKHGLKAGDVLQFERMENVTAR